MGLEVFINQIIEDIENGEFTVAALDGGDGACDWVYTIGLYQCFGHPEVIIVGLDPGTGAALAEITGNEIARGRVLTPYVETEILDGVYVVPTPVDRIWLTRGEWFDLGRAIMETWGRRWPPTLQLVWSDGLGRRPERPGGVEWMLRQPLLVEGDGPG